ncbi:sigma-70 family RNA polymerase sigma factor [Nocardia sp. ET3-3]|uniref:Sigma-70 family RNA polymerase sigma factor n=2 Tax=Nocardia terrae TaxID=2675851 RepID=A0A7K1UT70_9NOCA|nr:sigma-70 family RNA polymerase sigma factor [Nocardia terrae]
MRTERSPDNGRILTHLIGEIAGGNRDAFTEFYRMTSHRVFGLALRMLYSPETAEEVTQEVYLQVWSVAERFDQRLSTPIGWLMMLTHRRSVDRVRSICSATGRDIVYGRTHMDRERDVVVEAVEERHDRRAVLHCLETLTELQRETITLAYYGGLSYPDVADRLGKPVATIKSRIRGGLERLRTCLAGGDHR